MNKNLKVFILILATIVCVSSMLFLDKIQACKNIFKDNIELVNSKNISKQNIEKDNEEVGAHNINNSNQFVITDKYKKFKMEMLDEQINGDKADFFQENIRYSSKKNEDKGIDEKTSELKEQNKDQVGKSDTTIKQNVNNKKEEVYIFNNSKSKVGEILTSADKSKLLLVSNKLSAIDYDKVKEYLGRGSNNDVINVIRLLKERLSDKEYDEISDIAEKFINNNAVKQW